MKDRLAFMNRIEYALKHNKALLWLYRVAMSTLFRFMGLFVRTDDDLVLISSFGGKRFDDSPKAIFEQMLERSDCEKFRFAWAFVEPEKFNLPRTRCVKMNSLAYFVCSLKARYWITNVNIERGLRFKKPETIYVNTWHGTPLKTIGNAVDGRFDYDFSHVDLITSDGDYFSQIMMRDFNANPASILKCGRPREDELYRLAKDGNREKICSKLGIPPTARVVLYAPTWRESADGGLSYGIKPPVSIGKWREMLGADSVILFRAHSITTKVTGFEFGNRVLDCSEYPCVNELLFIADVLVTDYSGILFDYAGLEKPIICFAYDFEEYRASRGIYFDIREHLTTFFNEDDLLSHLVSMDDVEESAKSKAFFEAFAGCGGNATDACIDRMLDIRRLRSS
ncbi:CDP-glycerol glycerophosphotransferase family protein [Gordonibacter sp. RACS_AR49]|uniref:CDP-glycerol glycerophosphotransferase family protein n=1 Tax=Gordonibacter sp. RACS_AR49 TaxID=2871986 RepID=UPI0026093651|nr:CDP-glycerol glycerophosphotransferase family protein [Gordonibacter sp. RACS_AR49]MDN4509351.1 CDP-glycerol glycerophosphotransferase family protein [Gordonibacter sp. RACS_AR49]